MTAAARLPTLLHEPGTKVATDAIVTLLGAGQAGADFIEVFMRKAQPKA